jgi:hypothetical protein
MGYAWGVSDRMLTLAAVGFEVDARDRPNGYNGREHHSLEPGTTRDPRMDQPRDTGLVVCGGGGGGGGGGMEVRFGCEEYTVRRGA